MSPSNPASRSADDGRRALPVLGADERGVEVVGVEIVGRDEREVGDAT